MERVRYFPGQVLSTADFQAEQDYLLGRHRRLNLRFHGVGIVSGLRVSIPLGIIRVSPGVAIDPHGHEIVVEEPQVLALPTTPACVSLAITYAETLTRPVPSAGGSECSRIAEGFVLHCAPGGDLPADAVLLARLRPFGGRWRVEPRAGGGSAACWAVGILLAVLCLCPQLRTFRQ